MTPRLTIGRERLLTGAVERRLLDRVPVERMDTVRRLVFTGVVLAALAPAAPPAQRHRQNPPIPPPPTRPRRRETRLPPRGPEPTKRQPRRRPSIDDSGNPVATITYVASEVGFSDYEEGNDPEAGNEYVRVLVTVESLITEGTFNIGVDDFILQSNNGFVTRAENVPTATQAEADEDITERRRPGQRRVARPHADVRGGVQRRSAVGLLQPRGRSPRRRRRARLTDSLTTSSTRGDHRLP